MTEWIVSSSALIALVVLLRRLLRGRICLRLQYALWLLVLLRLLIPGTVGESALSVQRPLEAVRTYEVMNLLPEDTYYEEDGDIRMVQGGLPGDIFDQMEDGTYGGYVTQDGTFLPAPQIVAWTEWKKLAFGVWYAGMALTGLLLVLSNLSFYRKLRRTRHLLDVDASTKIYVTEAIQSPCLFGLPWPAIYVPAAVAEDGEALGHVLAHEEAHYRHGDHLWTALRGVCLVLHWYNPLVWWAAALSRRDCELACDEAAVKALGEAERAAYGRTLVGLAEQHSGLMRCATSMSGSDLKARVAALVERPATRRTAAAVMALAVAAFALCAFTGARESAPNWSTPEEFATWVEPGSAGTAVAQMRSTYPDGREYVGKTVGVTWVAEHITGRFADYEWTRAMSSDTADGLCLEIRMEEGDTLRLYENDVAELAGNWGTVWYRAACRGGADGSADSIFAVCREQYDQLVMGSLTDLTLPGTAEGEAAEALYTLWNSWLARAAQKLPPDSRWGITDYSLGGTVTGMTTAEDGGDVRATWEMDVLLQPVDYENTFWWIGNAVGAEVDYGADYAGWIELGYQGWLIRDGESGLWSIPDFGTGGYTMENLLTAYPPAALREEGSIHAVPYECHAWTPAGAEVTGYGAEGGDTWVEFVWDGVGYTMLSRPGGERTEWVELVARLPGNTAAGEFLRASGQVDFYTAGAYTAAVWSDGEALYVLTVEASPPWADEVLESLLAQHPEPILGTGASSSAAAVYVYEKEGFGGNFTIALDPDGTFRYNEGLLSSHMGLGTWAVEGDILTLREDEESGYGFVNRFTVTPEGLVFQAEGSDNFLYVKAADGDLFLGPPLETEAGEEGT